MFSRKKFPLGKVAAGFGIGALVANSVCPYLLQKVFTANGITDFRALFLVPMSFALLCPPRVGLRRTRRTPRPSLRRTPRTARSSAPRYAPGEGSR